MLPNIPRLLLLRTVRFLLCSCARMRSLEAVGYHWRTVERIEEYLVPLPHLFEGRWAGLVAPP